MNEFTLHIESLHKQFGKTTVFKDLTYIHKTGILGIAGPNGSGKSTLMRCLAGLLRPTKGTVHWDRNGNVFPPAEIKPHLGFAAPYINAYELMTCNENLQFILNLRKRARSSSSIDDALRQTGIADLADQYYRSLSTGQKQRLRIAMAIVHQPAVLMLDEPGSNLDESGHHQISTLIASFAQEGKTVIVASNDPDELALCDTICTI